MIRIMPVLLAMFGLLYAGTPNTCDNLVSHPNNKLNPFGVEGVEFENVDTKKAIEACTKAVEDSPHESRYSYQLGRAYYISKNYQKAFEWYKKAALKNYPPAQNELGNMYLMGQNDKNFKEAENGFTPEKGTEESYRKSLEWYLKSANNGNISAMLSVASAYRYGKGVKKDYREALKWYMKASEEGSSSGKNTLGHMYYNGEGVKKDYSKALNWYMNAADNNYSYAMNNIGEMYQNGEGVEKDIKSAIEWYKKSTKIGDLGSYYAQIHLGDIYYNGVDVKQNHDEAFEWYIKASENNEAFDFMRSDTLVKIAEIYSDDKDYKKAFDWYMKAAELGDVHATSTIGRMYERGIGIKRNYKESLKWYIKAAKQGDASSQYTVAKIFLKGKGVKRNYIRAYAWFSLSSVNGVDISREKLNELEKKMTPQQISSAQNYDPLKENTKTDNKSNTKPTEVSQPFTGTGFFVDKSKVLTNHHVVKDCRSVELVRNGYKSGARVVAKDSINDLALIKADKLNNSFLNFRAGKGIRIGDDIVVIGYPFGDLLGSGIKLTAGNVSALTGILNDTRQLQLTAPVQPGNSGGALLDKSGNVVGVIVARFKQGQNVNLAIKSNVAQMFLDINNVDYSGAVSEDIKDVADIADEAKESIVQVVCHQ